jgi:hypothetical protein
LGNTGGNILMAPLSLLNIAAQAVLSGGAVIETLV